MKRDAANRREYLQRAGIMGTAAMVGRALPAAARAAHAGAIRLGGPTFSAAGDPDELAQAHRRLGYRAAYCPSVDLKDQARIREIERAFDRHDVVIAEVGRWLNLLEADAAKRAANLRLVTEGLALAEAIGARCCVDIAGSFHPTIWYGPDPRNLTPGFFDAAVENARKIIDAVQPRRAKFCYEMMGWSLPDSPDSCLKMIKAVNRPAFAVHLDPCNLINSPERFYHNTELLNECFDKLGPWLASCHAKDLTWDVEMNIHFREVPLGAGRLDYETYLKRLAALATEVPLMLEHMKNQAEYNRCREHIFGTGRKLSLKFD
jgi:sugar phosphate isomerase/epimerase